MEPEQTSAELDAFNKSVQALRELSPDARRRVINAVLTFLGSGGLADPGPPVPPSTTTPSTPMDIRTLKEQKNPGSAIEMATLVAFYLRNCAEERERKERIGTPDVERYFNQAAFPLPARPEMTLFHAKNSGYLEALGDGIYRLTPVGHNLIMHTLPRTSEQKAVRRGKRIKRGKSKREK